MVPMKDWGITYQLAVPQRHNKKMTTHGIRLKMWNAPDIQCLESLLQMRLSQGLNLCMTGRKN